MFADEVDYEKIREIMLKLADILADLGFPNVRTDIESKGERIGRAVANPRTHEDLHVIKRFMQSLAQDILHEEAAKPTKQLYQAKIVVDKAYQALGRCIQ